MFDVGVHNWCTNKNLTGETCFFFSFSSSSSCVFWQYICCFCCFRIWFKFTFPPLFKSLDRFISLSLIFPLEPESCQNWGATKIIVIKRIRSGSIGFLVGGACSVTLRGWRCWWRRAEAIWVLIKREFISPLDSPLATSRSIYKSNRLFASQSRVIYDPAPLARPASFHFC